MPEFYKKIFNNNKEWVKYHLETDPNYFKDLSEGQNPPILWIGCSDSRVPANVITGLQPGVAHFAHLGGMAAGALLLVYWSRTRRLM